MFSSGAAQSFLGLRLRRRIAETRLGKNVAPAKKDALEDISFKDVVHAVKSLPEWTSTMRPGTTLELEKTVATVLEQFYSVVIGKPDAIPGVNLGDLYKLFHAAEKFVAPHIGEYEAMKEEMSKIAAAQAKTKMVERLDAAFVSLLELAVGDAAKDEKEKGISEFIAVSKSSSGLCFAEKEGMAEAGVSDVKNLE